MLLRTAARRAAAARPSLRRTAPQAITTRPLAYQGLHEALEKKLGTQPTRLPQDAEDLPKSFDVGERAAELGVRLSQHELDNLYAELKKGTKKESNAAYVDAVQATASVGAERQYLAEFITSSDEHSTGQKVLLFLDYLSTALFALIGAQYAGIAGMNVVGATLVGVVGGVGGGTVTGALTGANAARGVFWMRDPRYLLLSTVVAVATCVEINQCVGCTRQFFTKSFLADDAAVLARSSGEEPASPRHRAGVASMAWRATR
jgi:hypothetical protein